MTTTEQLQTAIAEREALRPAYRRAINPNNSTPPHTAQRIEAEFAAIADKVKQLRAALRNETKCECGAAACPSPNPRACKLYAKA